MAFNPNRKRDHLYSIKIERPNQNQTGWFGGFSIFKEDENVNEYRSFTENGHTYYSVPHNKEYAVRMINNSDLRVNATLKIDGEVMGVWRINQYADVIIERPSHSNRKFTFVKESSWQAGMGGVKQGDVKNGLVEVTFTPEKRTLVYNDFESPYINSSFSDSLSMGANRGSFGAQLESQGFSGSRKLFSDSASSHRESTNQMFNSAPRVNYSAGATVLGDDSSQRFGTASHMIEDTTRSVTKRVRIVVAENRKPYTSIKKPSVDVYDDPVPPPINVRTFEGVSSEYARPRRMHPPLWHNEPEWRSEPEWFDGGRPSRQNNWDSFYS
ncbi:hypothetical protein YASMINEVIRUS_1329 [Yasminevirus sp. GU-2018]|uniref:Uncharacterized protein n=1 Tax=Yasminevirus sp. GU-2018 TaxID=2420051 RepID=A0A5K0U9X6_9VIRU|nr:hypothetical protein YASMINEVIRUS_1329 [Yasminevirus sp. GU-2018]